MTHTWHSVDLRTGRRGPQLPTRTRGTAKRIIGEATDTQVDVLTYDQDQRRPWPGWFDGTTPGRSMLLLVDDNDEPLWGGMVLRRIINPSIWATVGAATLEHYLGRRYVADLTFDGADQATIAAGIIGSAAVDGLDFTIDAPATGVLRDRSYFDDEDKTVLAAITDLMNVIDGVEFTVDLEWTDTTHSVLRRILRARPRIGTGRTDPVRFEMPGPVRDFTLLEDYTPEHGGNDVMAVSSGEGESRPKSNHWLADDLLAAGWPRYERRFTPSSSITDTTTLDSHALDELDRIRDGLLELSLVANLDAAPRLNADWWLGDDITAVLTCPALPAWTDPDGAWQPGYEHTVRVVGWEINLDDRTLTPTVREVS